MVADRPYLGILLMLVFCVLVPLADGLGKLAIATMPVIQVVAVRFIAQTVMLVPFSLATGRSLRLPRDVMIWTFWRTVLHAGAIGLLFAALVIMPLAETLAIVFVQPFMLIIVVWLFLREDVGWRRLAACGTGFAGSLLIIQPSFVDFGPVALLPLAVAVCFTIFILITRKIAKRCDPVALQAVSGVMALPMILPLLALGPLLGIAPLTLVMPDATGWWLLLGIGLLGTLSHLLMTLALRITPSSTLAPVQYMELPFVVIVGWVLFRDFPDALGLTGIGVILAAGLYIVMRERRLNREPQPVPQAPLPVQPLARSPASRGPKG